MHCREGPGVSVIVGDGAGGAIIAWYDGWLGPDDMDIYAQRVDAAGVPQWTTDGVKICGAALNQRQPTIVSDGAGGAIISWEDGRDGFPYIIYTQRMDGAGVPQWTPDGVPLPLGFAPKSVSDGSGGALITWYRGLENGSANIYAQRVDHDGLAQWSMDGVLLSPPTYPGPYGLQLAPDGFGGAVVAFLPVSPNPNHLRAQRVTAAGAIAPGWPDTGAAVCTLSGFRGHPNIVVDDAGSAIVTWLEMGTPNQVRAQRLDPMGAMQWTASGVPCSGPADGESHAIVSDGASGVIVIWGDASVSTQNTNIRAQHLTAAGTLDALWDPDGVSLCTASGKQEKPVAVPAIGNGAIAIWPDQRNGEADIYAQRILANGVVASQVNLGIGETPPAAWAALAPNAPNPFARSTLITFTLARDCVALLEVFDMGGRRVDLLVEGRLDAGRHSVSWNGTDTAGQHLPAGVYSYRLTVPGFHSYRKLVILK